MNSNISQSATEFQELFDEQDFQEVSEEILEKNDFQPDMEKVNQTYPNDDINIKEDLFKGQIYLAHNQINGKKYVGQATCFTGENNNRWGTLGRWKSHVREATGMNQNNCSVLNSAIRKYGEDSFVISTLIKCDMIDLNNYERFFVNLHNSMVPNGYNVREAGGSKGRNNPITIQKMKDAHMGAEHSEETKSKISKGQIGNRRSAKKRNNPEDNDLPKYVMALRSNGVLRGYCISCFPIGIDTKEYAKNISFMINSKRTKEEAYEQCIAKLEEMKIQYKHIDEEIEKIKEESIQENIHLKKEEQFLDKMGKLIQKLPEYIFPIIENNKIIGYYVEGFKNNNGVDFPRKEFTEKTNRWNLDSAEKLVEMYKYINLNNVKLEYIDFNTIEVNDVSKSFYKDYYLPKYLNILNTKGEMKGLKINGFPDSERPNGKYEREFRFRNLQRVVKSFDETYQIATEYLKRLKDGQPYWKIEKDMFDKDV